MSLKRLRTIDNAAPAEEEEPSAKRPRCDDAHPVAPLLVIAPKLILAVASHLQLSWCSRLAQTCKDMRNLLADFPTLCPRIHSMRWGNQSAIARKIDGYALSKPRLQALEELVLIQYVPPGDGYEELTAQEITTQLQPIIRDAANLHTVFIMNSTSNVVLRAILELLHQHRSSTMRTLRVECPEGILRADVWQLIGRCTGLRRLGLSFEETFYASAHHPDADGFSYLGELVGLEALELISNTRMGPSIRAVELAFSGMQALRELVIYTCPWLSADHMAAIGDLCRHRLRRLTIRGCSSIGRGDLFRLIDNLRLLESLTLQDNPWFDNDAMRIFGEYAPQSLRKLHVDMTFGSNDIMRSFARSAAHLETLVFRQGRKPIPSSGQFHWGGDLVTLSGADLDLFRGK